MGLTKSRYLATFGVKTRKNHLFPGKFPSENREISSSLFYPSQRVGWGPGVLDPAQGVKWLAVGGVFWCALMLAGCRGPSRPPGQTAELPGYSSSMDESHKQSSLSQEYLFFSAAAPVVSPIIRRRFLSPHGDVTRKTISFLLHFGNHLFIPNVGFPTYSPQARYPFVHQHINRVQCDGHPRLLTTPVTDYRHAQLIILYPRYAPRRWTSIALARRLSQGVVYKVTITNNPTSYSSWGLATLALAPSAAWEQAPATSDRACAPPRASQWADLRRKRQTTAHTLKSPSRKQTRFTAQPPALALFAPVKCTTNYHSVTGLRHGIAGGLESISKLLGWLNQPFSRCKTRCNKVARRGQHTHLCISGSTPRTRCASTPAAVCGGGCCAACRSTGPPPSPSRTGSCASSPTPLGSGSSPRSPASPLAPPGSAEHSSPAPPPPPRPPPHCCGRSRGTGPAGSPPPALRRWRALPKEGAPGPSSAPPPPPRSPRQSRIRPCCCRCCRRRRPSPRAR
eukprot:494151-Prorocentrum_minimum.AAC.1